MSTTSALTRNVSKVKIHKKVINDGIFEKDGSTKIKATRTSLSKEDRVFTIYQP